VERQVGVVYLDLEAFTFNPLQYPLIQVVVAREELSPPGGMSSLFDIGSGERIPHAWVPAIDAAEVG